MTDDNIKEVINRTSIVEIINSSVPLKKKGSNYFGLSPFKKEKTPSFSVNEEKKIFHCFSTGEHGNVIDFLIKVKGYSFKDALYELADKAGIVLSYKSSKLNNIIYEINLFAKDLFYKNLLNSKIHLEYLQKKRNFNIDTIHRFELGSSVNSFHLQKKFLNNFEVNDLVSAGIFSRTKNSKLFFSNRIMVPITNLQNKTLGFGGRVINDSLPKYINTAETKIFKKKQILFNEKILNKQNNKKIIIVEGYFDVIKLEQSGFKNCLAPLGTSINHEKLIEITKKGFEIIVCLDGDIAGRNATIRLMNNLLSDKDFELGIKFVLLPKNFDPDQLIESNMSDKLNKLLDQPLSIEELIEKYLEKFSKSNDVDSQFKGSKVLKSLLDNISNIDLKKILTNHFNKISLNKIPTKNNSKPNNQKLDLKFDLKSKFSAALIIFYIENASDRERVFDLIATAKFEGKFREIRDIIIKKTLFKSTTIEIYQELDSKGLNFTKNLLFSNEVRRLCRFASPKFNEDPYNEIEKTISFINS